MENIKIKIPNPEISEKVQKRAFSLGYRWISGDKTPINLGSSFLYFSNDGYIGYGNSLNVFETNFRLEVTWQDFLYKDVDINNCKIPVFSYTDTELIKIKHDLKTVLVYKEIKTHGNHVVSEFSFYSNVGYSIRNGRLYQFVSRGGFENCELPELSVDYILENYKEKEMEVLPEKWCVRCNIENYDTLQTWFTEKTGLTRIDPGKSSLWHYPTRHYVCTSSTIFEEYTEITFDQFKRLVLKQTDNKMDEITLKCIKSPVRAKNITENNTYTGIYIDEEETQVDSYDEAVYFLCENNRGVPARYNIDLFEKPVVVKPTITLETLLDHLTFTDTSIKFKDVDRTLILVNNGQTHLLKSTQAANSCGIYLIGNQGEEGGVDGLYNVIYDAINDGAWGDLEELYEIQGGSDEIIFKLFSEYIKWKMSTLSAGFFILSTNSDSATVELLDEMECLKTEYSVNPNSGREIKMWIFDNDIPMEEDDEEEAELRWG